MGTLISDLNSVIGTTEIPVIYVVAPKLTTASPSTTISNVSVLDVVPTDV